MMINDQNTKTNETNVALFERGKKTNSHPYPSRDGFCLHSVHSTCTKSKLIMTLGHSKCH